MLWALMPHIEVARYYPFQSMIMRITILIIAITIWQRRKIRSLISNPHKIKLFLNQNRGKYYLKKMPLYIILGDYKALQLNNNKPIHPYQIRLKNKFKNTEWIFNKNAIFITKHNDALIKYIAKHRKNIPINGIITILPINNIAATHEIKKIVMDINKPFKHSIPTYVIFSHTNEIIGFDEFFEDISYEETLQTWEIQITKDNFEHQYNNMLSKLQKRTLWLMSKISDSKKRSLIFAFPQQLHLLKQYIANTLFENTRSIYFCANNEYFNSQIMNSCILQECNGIGFSHRYKLIYKYKPIVISFLFPLLIFACYLILHTSFSSNQETTRKINKNIDNYQRITKNIPPDSLSILGTVKALNIIDNNQALLNSNRFYSNFILSKHLLIDANKDTLIRTINSLFLTRVAAILEHQLKTTPANNINALYTLLKAYLAFSPSYNNDAESIVVPMLFYWQQLHHQSSKNFNLIKHFLILATKNSLIKLPLDQHLIKSIKQKLLKIAPSQRGYALLNYRAETQNINTALIRPPLYNHYPLNPLYTLDGYQQIVEKYIDLISSQVANDNNKISSSQNHQFNQHEIKNKIYQLYNKHYISNWQTVLINIHLKNCQSLPKCIALGESLSSNTGALDQLIKLIINNTSTINNHQLTIDNYYKPYIAYSKQALTKLQNDIKSITDILINAKQSNDPQQYLFLQAQQLYQSAENPLSKLTQDSDAAPIAVKRIINQLTHYFRHLITTQASLYINKQWNHSVRQFFMQNLLHKFPINRKSNDQISIEDFNRFFSDTGLWMTFYNKYIKTFNSTNTTISRLVEVNQQYFKQNKLNIEINLKPKLLSQNSKSIAIQLGQRTINYQHGPRNTNLIIWPSENTTNSCSIAFEDFQNNKHTLSFAGPWSIFNCFNTSRLYLIEKNHYLLHLNIDHHTAVFNVTTNINKNAFTLKMLQSLTLPRTLILIK